MDSDKKKRELIDKIRRQQEKLNSLQIKKSEISDQFFKDTKVVTCSQVLVKNGHIVAIPFKPERGDDYASVALIHADSSRKKGVEHKVSLEQ